MKDIIWKPWISKSVKLILSYIYHMMPHCFCAGRSYSKRNSIDIYNILYNGYLQTLGDNQIQRVSFSTICRPVIKVPNVK